MDSQCETNFHCSQTALHDTPSDQARTKNHNLFYAMSFFFILAVKTWLVCQSILFFFSFLQYGECLFCFFVCSCSWSKLSFSGKSLWRGLCSFLTLEKLRRCSLFFSTTCFLSRARRRDSQRRSALIILYEVLSFTALLSLLSWFWPVQPFLLLWYLKYF